MSETIDILAGAPEQDVNPTSAASPTGSSGEPVPGVGPAARTRRRGGGLTSMVLSELQEIAAELGITGTARMRKNDLIAAIKARQSGSENGGERVSVERNDAVPTGAERDVTERDVTRRETAEQGTLEVSAAETSQVNVATVAVDAAAAADQPTERTRRVASRPAGSPVAEQAALPEPSAAAVTEPAAATAGATSGAAPEPPVVTPVTDAPAAVAPAADGTAADGTAAVAGQATVEPTAAAAAGPAGPDVGERVQSQPDQPSQDRPQQDRSSQDRAGHERGQGRPDRGQRVGGEGGEQPRAAAEGQRERGNQQGGGQRGNQRGDNQRGNQQGGSQQGGNQRDNAPLDDDDEDGGGRNRRGRRFRDRRSRGGRERYAGDAEPVIAEDDVLVPVAGILDILDNYAFIRTSGYLPGPNDVYVSLSQVRRNGLRRGDAITGAVRQPREGERRDKFNALVRLDTVNGAEPELGRNRPEFTKLIPLYPQDRLRLETEAHILTTRVIDLVVPIGKGQRALIVSPPKAGKTMVLQAIANAITTNNPECHLMVVLIDERPEEVTDMQRSVKGEVIASTFDRPPTDHTTVAELSIERAKRLVELGHDVVVLLDSITRLGRAYNNASPASGRILSGGIDSTALYPPKRFLGAARNIENGGSLTILATALVETGSTGDTVIFEEFKGTGNAELKLDRKIADKRVFPAVDVIASSTRKEEILLAPEEMAIMIKLRRVLYALDPQQAIDLLLDKLKETRTNVEFLMQVQKTTITQD